MIRTDNNQLTIIFGRKRCGKSCTMAKLASQALKKGQHVYCNTPLFFDNELFHCVDTKFFGHFTPEPYSLYLLDEINLFWDNRDFKSFSKDVQKFFRYQGHFKCTVIAFSQTWDCDLKIRSLTDNLFVAKKWFGRLTVMKRIEKFITIIPPSDKSEGGITEGFQLTPFFVPGARQFTWLPKWWRYVDSYSLYDLPSLDDLLKKEG